MMCTHHSSAAVGALLDRYLITLDDDELDEEWVRGLFTEDAVVEFPMSRHAGREGLAGYHRDALAAFAGTQHLNSPAVLDRVDGEEAAFRANLISTQTHHPGAAGEPLFTTGTLVTGRARRTADGWRLTALSFRLLWTTGRPPGGPR
jgi:hypothetical protein